ncbi:MAG TPA: hypothetical protein VLS27_15440, partial [Gammaproteobacteria bacterium]|nr:hypothetical protein [Gammaproteobacteria bacterium]
AAEEGQPGECPRSLRPTIRSIETRSNPLASGHGIAGAADARRLPPPNPDSTEAGLEHRASGAFQGLREL